MTRRAAFLAFLLAGFWLVLSAHYTALLLACGVLSVGLVMMVVHRMDRVDESGLRIRPPLAALRYACWLAWQITTSSLAVLRQVWSPRLASRPVVATTPVHGLSEVGTVAYANSITLTPGTLSLQVGDEGIEVHALRETSLDDLRGGQMLDRVRALEP